MLYKNVLDIFFLSQIGSNGVIGLGEEFNRISIYDINSKQLKNRHIVCPFWSDLKDDVGHIYYKTYQRYEAMSSNFCAKI